MVMICEIELEMPASAPRVPFDIVGIFYPGSENFPRVVDLDGDPTTPQLQTAFCIPRLALT